MRTVWFVGFVVGIILFGDIAIELLTEQHSLAQTLVRGRTQVAIEGESIYKSDINHITQSSSFRPAKHSGILFLPPGKEKFYFKINDANQSGYMVRVDYNGEITSELFPFLSIFEFFDRKGKSILYGIGDIDINHIKEIEILEKNVKYSDHAPGEQYRMLKPHYKVRMMFDDNKNYTALVDSFGLIDDQKQSGEKAIQKIEIGAKLVRLSN
jgi:hypothetical protein